VTTVYRTLKLEHYLAAIVLLPVLWSLGHLAPTASYQLEMPHIGSLQSDALTSILILQVTALATALVVGYVAACVARALGREAIRTLLSPSQAQLFGLLATSALWIACTGLSWENFQQNEPLTIAWYIITGAAVGLYGAVWLLLAVRAAATVKPFQTMTALAISAEGCFLSALGGLLLLVFYLNGANPEPSLLLFGIAQLLNITLILVPPALAVAAGAALWSGILKSRERPADDSSAPAD
jgi:hypothetical protein